MAKTTKWLNAILHYMRKVKSSISIVFGLNLRQLGHFALWNVLRWFRVTSRVLAIYHRLCVFHCTCMLALTNGRNSSASECLYVCKVIIILRNFVRFKALFSSYAVICSPWRPLWMLWLPSKENMATADFIATWWFDLYCGTAGDPSEIDSTKR